MHTSYTLPDDSRTEDSSASRTLSIFDDFKTIDVTPKVAYKCAKWTKNLPQPTPRRLSTATRPISLPSLPEQIQEKPIDFKDNGERPTPPEPTVLYLAYGSNLSAETFQGKRGIRPLSAITVLVPALSLTFDLPGVPYAEPCFANTAYRTAEPPNNSSEKEHLLANGPSDHPHNPPPFPQGLVGVVYEVTATDYAHIIATEGGGASYHDVLVPCHPLPPSSPTVPAQPDTPVFLAHTLFAPSNKRSRPYPDYAQPSPRYLKLLRDGADEHSFPEDYKQYLASLPAYRITSRRQQLGQFIFMMIWWPIVAFLFGLGKIYKDGKGRSPPWLVWMLERVFEGMWKFYDGWFKSLFGEGGEDRRGGR